MDCLDSYRFCLFQRFIVEGFRIRTLFSRVYKTCRGEGAVHFDTPSSLKYYNFILWRLCGRESLDYREALQEWSHIDWEECDVIFNFQVFVVDEVGS